MKRAILLSSGVCALIASATGQAQLFRDYGPVFNYGIGLRVEHENNVELVPGGESEDTLLAPFIDFGISRLGPKLDIDVSGLVEYASYLDNTFDSEFRGNLSADATYRVVDGRLNWVLQNGLTRANVNVLAVQTPDNIQQNNSFSTGPDLLLNPSVVDRIVVGARYNNFLADNDDISDSDGTTIFAQWSRALSAANSVGLSVQSTSTSFEQDILEQPDYDRRQISADFTREAQVSSGLNSLLSIAVGYGEAAFDGGDDIDTPYFRMNWTRQLPGGQGIGINLVREIGDIFADTLNFGGAVIVPPVQETVVVRDPFVRNSLGLTWSKELTDRHRLTTALSYDEQDFAISSPLDQELLRARVGLQWQIRPLLALNTGIEWTDQQFVESDQVSERLDLTVGLNYQRTRNVFLDFGFQYVDESNSVGALEFDNLAFRAQISYRR